MIPSERCLNTLEAGRVARYHAVPSVGSQNLGHHQWGVLVIALYLDPDASRELLLECALHDSAELFTGDVPFTVKRDNPDIKERFDAMEDTARRDFLLLEPQDLSEHDKAILKLADTLEGLIWCRKTELSGPVKDRWVQAIYNGLQKFESVLSSTELHRARDLFVRSLP